MDAPGQLRLGVVNSLVHIQKVVLHVEPQKTDIEESMTADSIFHELTQ